MHVSPCSEESLLELPNFISKREKEREQMGQNEKTGKDNEIFFFL